MILLQTVVGPNRENGGDTDVNPLIPDFSVPLTYPGEVVKPVVLHLSSYL